MLPGATQWTSSYVYSCTNSSFCWQWTVISIGAWTMYLLRRLRHNNIRWTVVWETLLLAPCFICSVSCSTIACLFAWMHLGSHCSLLSSMSHGEQNLPCHWFWTVPFCHAWYTFTMAACKKFSNLAILEMFPLLARKPVIMPFRMSDESVCFCITSMIAMFSEALTHPSYMFSYTVLPSAICDWLFNVTVEYMWSSH